MTQEKEIHFTGYEKQISNWTDLIPAERFTLLVLQTLTEVSKDPRGTYITNDRLSNIIGLSPTRISSTITNTNTHHTTTSRLHQHHTTASTQQHCYCITLHHIILLTTNKETETKQYQAIARQTNHDARPCNS